MKNIQTLFCAAICGAVLAFTYAASAQDAVQALATVVRVQGAASYTLGGGDGWHPLVAGKILWPGSAIKTETDATVDVVLAKQIQMPQAHPTPDKISPAPDAPVRGMVDYKPSAEQNVIRLSGDTMLKIDTLTVSDTGADTISDTELNLQDGGIFYSVKKLSPESKFLIKFPNGIAGVRGSQGFCHVSHGRLDKCGALLHPLFVSCVGSGSSQAVTTTCEEGRECVFDDSGNSTSSPMSADNLKLLGQVSQAARTCYVQVCAYAFNIFRWCHISPTTGNKGHHRGGGNSGNGNGNGNQGSDDQGSSGAFTYGGVDLSGGGPSSLP